MVLTVINKSPRYIKCPTCAVGILLQDQVGIYCSNKYSSKPCTFETAEKNFENIPFNPRIERWVYKRVEGDLELWVTSKEEAILTLRQHGFTVVDPSKVVRG